MLATSCVLYLYYSIALNAGPNEAPKQPLIMYSATDLQHARDALRLPAHTPASAW